MITTEIEGQDELNKLLQEEMKWTKRQPAENINTHLYFTDIQWMRQMRVADKNTIREKLMEKAHKYNAPLAAILVNKELKAKGKKGINGEKMAKAVEKRIRRAQSRTKFLASGCLGGLNDMKSAYQKGDIQMSKRFAPQRPPGVRKYGKTKGYAIPAKSNTVSVWGQITNDVGQGKQASKTVTPILVEGGKKAIRTEGTNIQNYINKKFREHYDRLKKGKI